MKVLLVDDSASVRASFGDMLDAVPGVEVIGHAEDVAGAVSLIEQCEPDLIVLDVELRHGGHGLQVLNWVMHTRPELSVIVLSNFTWHAMRSKLLAAGAMAYFDKADEFFQARDWIAARAAGTPVHAQVREF